MNPRNAVKCSLAFDRYGRRLFASLPSEMRIIALNVDSAPADREWYGVAGNGKSCTKVRRCGDGGLAVDAKLTYPKVVYKAAFFRVLFIVLVAAGL